jgi:HSP20 family protein
MTKRGQFNRLHDEIQELFDDLWQIPRLAATAHAFRPHVDCFLTEDPAVLTVVVELAGVDPDKVRVVVDERTLLVSGERYRPRVVGRYHQMEIDYGPFQRRLALPEDVDPGGARADYQRGLLTITLPVAQRPAPAGKVAIEIGRRS